MKVYITMVHLLGLALGAGGAFVSDALFLRAIRDRKISNDEIRLMNVSGLMTWLGFSILFASGVGLVLMDVERYLNSSKFLAKLFVVLMIFFNGIILHAYHLPFMKKQVGKALHLAETFEYRSKLMMVSGAVSATSWLTSLVLGSLSSIPFDVMEIIGIYGFVLAFAVLTSLSVRKRIFGLK